jgi:hypothetical protein
MNELDRNVHSVSELESFHAGICGLGCERPRWSTRPVSPPLPTRERVRLRRAAQLQEAGVYPGTRPRESQGARNSRQLPTPTEAFDALSVGADGANRPQPAAQQQQISGHLPMKTQLEVRIHANVPKKPKRGNTEFPSS